MAHPPSNRGSTPPFEAAKQAFCGGAGTRLRGLRGGNLRQIRVLGVDYDPEIGKPSLVGDAANGLTSSNDKDFFGAAPWHENVPAREKRA